MTAYAEGDRRTLKNLLSKDVYDGFDARDPRARDRRAKTSRPVSCRSTNADITGAEQRGRTAQITVRFVSQLVSVTRDRSGAVIEGSPDKVTDVTDVWTFARDAVLARSQLEAGRDRSRTIAGAGCDAGASPHLVSTIRGSQFRLTVFWLLCIVSPSAAATTSSRLKLADTQIEPVQWTDHRRLGRRRSRCRLGRVPGQLRSAIGTAGRPRDERPLRTALRAACQHARTIGTPTADQARAPSSRRISAPSGSRSSAKRQASLTGYYEPIVEGSRFPSPEFHVPLYRRPRDLLVAGQKPGNGAFPNTGAPSAASTLTSSSSPTTTAWRSRMARSTARGSKSAGSRIRSTACRSRSRARRA